MRVRTHWNLRKNETRLRVESEKNTGLPFNICQYFPGGHRRSPYNKSGPHAPMIEALPDVPPALLLLEQEFSKYKSWQDLRRRVKGMLRDLRDQSEVFASEHPIRSDNSRNLSRFEVHLHGGLDLLLRRGCLSPKCRIEAANRIARSVGLIADRVWLTDLLSEQFIDFGRPSNAKLDDVLTDFMVLSRLLPLIREGVVRFRSPLVPICSSCKNDFDTRVEATAEDLARLFGDEFLIDKRDDGALYANTGKCIEPNLIVSTAPGRSTDLASSHDLIKLWVSEEIRSTLWAAREASLTGGAIFSNSRIGLAGLLKQDGRLVDVRTLLLLDKQREFSVPWVSDLDAAQIVQLRQEASSALPAFREKMARAMSIPNAEALSSNATSTVVADLREQAVEVRSELDSQRKNAARYWKTAYGVLGLGISAYGVAADQLLPGVGGLLPVIQLLINHKTGHELDVSKITSSPGFVLVKAQDILSHVHDGRDEA